MTTTKIMVSPCMVTIWWYMSALTTVPFGRASWARLDGGVLGGELEDAPREDGAGLQVGEVRAHLALGDAVHRVAPGAALGGEQVAAGGRGRARRWRRGPGLLGGQPRVEVGLRLG